MAYPFDKFQQMHGVTGSIKRGRGQESASITEQRKAGSCGERWTTVYRGQFNC